MVAVKLMKWSPWPSVAKTRKFKVKVKPIKLQGFNFSGLEGDDANEKIVAIEMKWKGEQRIGLAPFGRKTFRRQQQRNEFSSEKILKQGEDSESYADWDDEGFENTCDFTFTGRDQKLGPWDISFTILYGEKTKSKAKLRRIGKTCLNIAEMVAKKDIQVEKMLQINLHLGRVTSQANLLVLLNFAELRGSEEDSVESNGQTSERVNNSGRAGGFFRSRRKTGNGELTELDSFDTQLNSVKKTTLFSWSRRHLSFKRPDVRLEGNSGGGGGEKASRCLSCVNDCTEDVQSRSSNSSSVDLVTSASGSHQKRKTAETLSESKSKLDEGLWESKEIMSRDGETKLKTKVFFASFDQCSNKAAGESACTALVAVIAHWLLSNKTSMPTRPVFDNLIIEGSSEWRKLCENDAYTNLFPDKHFDLETVLHADVRPIAISRNDSFVGFFSPEKFESLKEAMSFDEIWSDIERISAEYDDQQRIYIVSWNDHFFVLKVETNAYYIIDTLGERLFEGCNQAYILRFDDSTVMYGKTAQDDNKREDEDKDDEEKGMIICSRGKECCKEFIKRFLASITVGELEAEEKKGAASYYSLHNRLQIELNFSYLVVSSSLTSSPFSNSSNSASYYSTE